MILAFECNKLLSSIFDRAKSDKTIILKLKRLVIKLFDDFGVSLWTMILQCSEMFFLEKYFHPSLLTAFYT